MILVIDNYDSFVHNLARYCTLLGHGCEIYRNDAITLETIQALNPSHIILSPGPCTPNEAGICLDVIRHLAPHIPILGVCLGHQAIGQAYGATITQAQQPNHGKAITLSHQGQSVFAGLPHHFQVGLYHALAIAPTTLPPCLAITALSPHGDIMAIAHTQYPCVGVQFHPESILTEHGLAILRGFLRMKAKPAIGLPMRTTMDVHQ